MRGSRRPRSRCLAAALALSVSVLAAPDEASAEIGGVWRMVDARTGAFQSLVRVEVRGGVAQARIVRLAPGSELARCERCRGEIDGFC